jgi:Lipocalin-like domain
MNRRNIFSLVLVTALGVALLPATSGAQQKTLKDQLVGIWTALSAETTGPNGAKQQFYGAPAKGILILDAGGTYAQVLARPGRPKFKSINRFSFEATPEELKVAVMGTVATFGTWSANEADKVLSRRPEASLLPNDEGIEQKYSVTLAGDELKTTTVNSLTGLKTEVAYRRAK